MKTARVLITYDCNHNCEYCCNDYDIVQKSIRVIDDISLLKDYEEVLITGGEPLFRAEYLVGLLNRLREQNSEQKIYMYTAFHHKKFAQIYPLIDGVTLTLHKDDQDISELLLNFQLDMMIDGERKNNRLSIDPDIDIMLLIIPMYWKSIKIKHWFTWEEQSKVIPPHEDLFYLREK
jgi:pyruvate-formate lyase-activating enzyme